MKTRPTIQSLGCFNEELRVNGWRLMGDPFMPVIWEFNR
jgi:hypothetical protein